MYRKGEVKIVAPPCETTDESGSCDFDYDDEHEHKVYDSSASENRGEPKERRFPAVYLPHSCDAWVIGGADEIRLMIADLQEALEKISVVEEREKQ